MTTWIVVADSSRARLFEMRRRPHEIRELEDFVNPQGRADARDLQADADGRFYAKGGPGQTSHAASPETDPVDSEIQRFARRLGGFLDKARTELRYEALYLIAPPKFLGLLRRNLGKETHRLVSKEIAKDLSHLDAATIDAHLRNGDL